MEGEGGIGLLVGVEDVGEGGEGVGDVVEGRSAGAVVEKNEGLLDLGDAGGGAFMVVWIGIETGRVGFARGHKKAASYMGAAVPLCAHRMVVGQE